MRARRAVKQHQQRLRVQLNVERGPKGPKVVRILIGQLIAAPIDGTLDDRRLGVAIDEAAIEQKLVVVAEDARTALRFWSSCSTSRGMRAERRDISQADREVNADRLDVAEHRPQRHLVGMEMGIRATRTGDSLG